MRTLLLPALFLVLGTLHGQVRPSMMPWPVGYAAAEGRLRVQAPVHMAWSGFHDGRLQAAERRWLTRMSDRTGLTLFGPDSLPGIMIAVAVDRKGDHLQVGEDESYAITIAEGGIRVQATTDLGALHAFATLYQLLQQDEQGWYLPYASISDAPRFPWRGLLLDVCRHFMPREVVLRELDGLELVKMNVLHLHLTEDQGFRVESRVFPELHAQGSEGQYLSQDDIRVILREAELRGIRVIPEFDLPGHATSWFVSHPEMASAPGPYQVETRFGVFDPTFDPTKEETYAFLDAFLGEMAALFSDPYLHIGGDENNGRQWDTNPAIQAYMQEHGIADNHALQAHFNTRLHAILKKHGKRMIGWDEIGEGELPDDITIQSWRGKEGLVKAAQEGRDVILSNGWYIDLCQSSEYHYLNDPVPADSPLSAEERKHVLGGEATMWAELVDARNVDTRIWPRTAAIAERLWSPADVTDVEDMYRRLEEVSRQLDALGLRHKSAQLELVRLIAGSDEAARELLPLVQVLAPVEGYRRHAITEHTTRTPLTRIADAAVPDPQAAREVEAFLDMCSPGMEPVRWPVYEHLRPREERVWLPSVADTTGIPDLAWLDASRSILTASAGRGVEVFASGTSLEGADCVSFRQALDRAAREATECRMPDLPAFERLYQRACPTPPR